MHSLLRRLVKRHLAGIDLSAPPWKEFLEAVNRTYAEADDDRQLVDRAMEISSSELLLANADLRGLVQAFPDLILNVDPSGRIVGQRGHGTGQFADAQHAVGRRLGDVVGPNDAGRLDEAIGTTLRTLGVTSVEYADAEAETVSELRLAPLEGGGVIAIVRDVTESRRMDEMRLARDGAEAASRAKSAFLANVSHELRTPLNAIIGYSEMLLEDASGGSAADLGRIRAAGLHLLQIVNTLLDVARIESGQIEFEIEDVGLAGLAEELACTIRPLAERNGNTVHIRVEPDLAALRTDRTKLWQVLLNLAGNACKFTEDGRIELSITGQDGAAGPGVQFAVHDTGIGIRAELIGRLFRDFVQGDESTTRRFGGTGLGLAISQRLCRLLGGRIDVDSTHGRGSTFTVWLPRTGPAADHDHAPELVLSELGHS